MARGEWGYNGGRAKWCSYRRTTLIICSINIGVSLYVLHTLYTSLYNYPFNDSQNAARYTPDQIRKMEESIRIRKASEPIELIKLVKQFKDNFLREEKMIDLPQPMKRKIADEILQRLRGLNVSSNATVQNGGFGRTYAITGLEMCSLNIQSHNIGPVYVKENYIQAVEQWRKDKLKECRRLTRGKTLNSTITPSEAGILARALKTHWPELKEEVGLWIPVDIINKEHDDKPEDEEEFDTEILAGRQLPPECHAELRTDYGGAAVRWGLTHHKESAYDCCQSCLDHARNAKPDEKKCNIWVYCPSEGGCYSPDIYEHKHQECWLKFAENPRVNFKDTYSESYRNSHANVPIVVPWVSGVVSA